LVVIGIVNRIINGKANGNPDGSHAARKQRALALCALFWQDGAATGGSGGMS
jgi:hypothetical protein